MHITARAPPCITSQYGDSGCLARQESLCPDPLDRITSVAAVTQLDAVVVVGGALDVAHRVSLLVPVAPPQCKRNNYRDSE